MGSEVHDQIRVLYHASEVHDRLFPLKGKKSAGLPGKVDALQYPLKFGEGSGFWSGTTEKERICRKEIRGSEIYPATDNDRRIRALPFQLFGYFYKIGRAVMDDKYSFDGTHRNNSSFRLRTCQLAS